MQNLDLSQGQETFNSLLSSTIQLGKPILPRNEIIETYIENDGIQLSTIKLDQTSGSRGRTGQSGNLDRDPWSQTSKNINSLIDT